MIEVRQKVGDNKGQIIKGKLGGPTHSADDGALFLGGLPRQPVWLGAMVKAVLCAALAPFTDGLGTDAIALGQEARSVLRAGDLRRGLQVWCGRLDGSAAWIRLPRLWLGSSARSAMHALQIARRTGFQQCSATRQLGLLVITAMPMGRHTLAEAPCPWLRRSLQSSNLMV